MEALALASLYCAMQSSVTATFSVLEGRKFSGGSQAFFFLKSNNVVFRFNQTDFYASPGPSGFEFKGPLWHPLRILANLVTWNMFILVPIFYFNIFKFRKSQELTTGMTYILRLWSDA